MQQFVRHDLTTILRTMKAALLLVALACVPGLACAGSSAPSASSHSVHSTQTLALRLEGAEVRLRGSLRAWRASDPALLEPPPAAALTAAAQERQIVHQLARSPALARRTLAALPPRLAAALGADVTAARDLQRLAGPATGTPAVLHLVPPRPAGELLADYRRANARFGVHWQLLAAVNLIETAFGRVAVRSSAGARGPMQFLPATWRAYGLGGDIDSPRDAILGAANYLHRSGAPGDDNRAVFAYNHSTLYVDAVLTYARQMTRDPLAYLRYYTWEASLPATLGG
jgi:soluble lytic murein transglycosylase-like protein